MIYTHQGTHLQKSAMDTVTIFNLLHEFNWPRKHQTTIAAWRLWEKSMITLYDESKYKLHTPLGLWRFENNKYMTYWQCFLYRDIHTLYYIEHVTCCKYTRLTNRSRRRIEFLTNKKSTYQRPSSSQVSKISLTSSTPTYLRVEATVIDLPRELSVPHI